MNDDILKIGEYEFKSRFILGSGKFSLGLLNAAINEAKAQMVTLALRRVDDGGSDNILDYIPKGITIILVVLIM
ncbi:hypothetical protein BB381_00055 [Campylobacter pinnipediorum subsp. caledonicus]|nr:hypothetical protein BB381_00055 [Campylobacter pinnipediorum subsp. caledonicus]